MIDWRPIAADRDDQDAELAPFGETTAPRRPNQTLRELPFLLGLAILIAFLFKTFAAQAFFIPSESMVPELLVGDRVVVSKVSYRLHEPRRGDVIVFDDPEPAPPDHPALPVKIVRGLLEAVGLRQPSTDEFIKRVIGLPGETVEAHSGRVYINGRELVEPYLPRDITTSDFGPVKLSADQLWVMGDNRPRSLDSRVFGPIRRDTIVGRAMARAWPLNRIAFL
jgi:signal peptidase I